MAASDLPTSQVSRSPLISLPAEIREQIYNDIFEGQRVTINRTPMGYPRVFSEGFTESHVTNVLRVCRQLNKEATPVFKALAELEYVTWDLSPVESETGIYGAPFGIEKVTIFIAGTLSVSLFGLSAFTWTRHISFNNYGHLLMEEAFETFKNHQTDDVFEQLFKNENMVRYISKTQIWLRQLRKLRRDVTGVDSSGSRDLSVSVKAKVAALRYADLEGRRPYMLKKRRA